MIINNKKFKTWPIVIHANGPGKEGEVWKKTIKMFEEMEERTEPQPEEFDLTIMTWTVAGEKTILQDCFAKMNVNLILLEIEKPFNWLDKIKRVKEILPYIDTKYVMCLDSTDVIVSTDEPEGQIWSDLINTFKDKSCKLLFNAEKYKWPEENRGVDDPMGMKHYINLLKQTEQFEERLYSDLLDSEFMRFNSGAFIGETEFTKTVYNKVWNITEPFYKDGINEGLFGGDQGFLRIAQSEFFPDMMIDYSCSIFQCLAGVEKEEVVLNV